MFDMCDLCSGFSSVIVDCLLIWVVCEAALLAHKSVCVCLCARVHACVCVGGASA